MMAIMYQHSCMWRYLLNPMKCVVLVFGESHRKQQALCLQRTWKLGDNLVKEATEHTHVGIHLQTTNSLQTSTSQACQKLKSSLISILGPGITFNGWNPLTAKHLYETVCLPTALYGCELWYNLTKSQIHNLEIARRFCVKTIQRLPKIVRTDICNAMLGFADIKSVVNYRKLLFLRRLIFTDDNKTVKLILTARLNDFITNCSKSSGYIADIIHILHEYDIFHVLEIYLQSGVFPSVCAWKHLVKNSISNKKELLWYSRISLDITFNRFRLIQTTCNIPSFLWTAARIHQKNLHKFGFLAKLSCVPQWHRAVQCAMV